MNRCDAPLTSSRRINPGKTWIESSGEKAIGDRLIGRNGIDDLDFDPFIQASNSGSGVAEVSAGRKGETLGQIETRLDLNPPRGLEDGRGAN